MTVGLRQLHGQEIAHQDLKPSNILVFKRSDTKVGDLGSASSRGKTAPRDGFLFADDPDYAPPESLYGYTPTEWAYRRLGCDLYLLGSVVAFFFAQTSMTALLLLKLDPSLHPKRWQGRYSDIMPYLREAFGRAVENLAQQIPDSCRDVLSSVVRQLCDPDPMLRGHPITRSRKENPLSLERYVSLFNLLATRAERGLFGG